MNIDDNGTAGTNAERGDYMGFANAEELRKAVETEERYLKRRRVRGAILRNVPTVLFFFAGVGLSILMQHLQ